MCREKSFCSVESFLCFLQIMVVVLLLLDDKTCDAITNNNTNCPPSSCGKMRNIKHPFRLKSDPTRCGDKRYELSCENNMTMLTLFEGKYYVKEINYKNYTIRLVDPAIEEGTDCSSMPRYYLYASNFTSNYNPSYLGDQYRTFQNRIIETADYLAYFYSDELPMFQHVIYMNCSNPVRDDPVYADTASCVKLNSEGYVYAIAGDLKVQNTKDDCHVEVVAAISFFDFNYSHYGGAWDIPNRKFSYGEIHRMLVGGFEVSWMSGPCEEVCNISNCFLSKITGIIQCTDWADHWGLIVFFTKLINIYRTRHTSMYENIEDFLQGNSLVPIRYSYKEIKNMTKSFKDKLGEGGYGTVYKGTLRSGPLVAIKMLGKSKGNGQDFINEVATIGRIHHTNVVRLIGFCVEGSKRALVYDFMPNGSLDRYISSRDDTISLTYKKMYEISLGVARGIAYLHQGCDMQILHFDIKPHNILLDEDFISKVSDFGLAKLYPVDNSIVSLTAARGTIGYMAPELFYKNIGGVSYKADVYSFGMLLMEIANRRRNLNSHADDSSQIFFPFWIYNRLIEEREIEILGDATDEDKNNVKKMFIIALWCIQLNPSDRPSMERVIEMLEGDIENIKIPPKPSPYPTEEETISRESISDDDISGSISFLEETVEDPLQ
uniref:Rust resistance kinase Lr10-like n=2 Tax=Cicer arietinum TaxID=3827 RepID=A0A1S3E4G7_CICAR|nr:rust resistance kinase Lr10-like [Cicer arietinum]